MLVAFIKYNAGPFKFQQAQSQIKVGFIFLKLIFLRDLF